MARMPRAQKPLTERVRLKLLRLARQNSEGFARTMMAAATALDDSESDGTAAATLGIEYVDTLNGIDVYEDGGGAAALPATATRLRSCCHIDADVTDVVRRLTASGGPSSTVLPGIVETYELCSVLDPTSVPSPEKEFPERIGVNWFVLDQETTRDSVSLRQSGLSTTRGSATARNSSESTRGSDRNSSGLLGDTPVVEFVVLSYQGVFKHRGRRGWVQWCQSVELSSFPVTPSDPKRGVLFSSGIVAVESATRPGQVSMSFAMGLDLSHHDDREIKFLERAVWKRILKLAALKKTMLRASLSRTLSIASTEMACSERSSQSSQEASPARSIKQPECEPVEKIQELRTQSLVVVKAPPPLLSCSEKRRPRAQTMQPSLSSVKTPPIHHYHGSPFRDPDSLEFRLSLYNDPAELPIGLPDSPVASQKAAGSTTRDAVASRFASAFKSTKSGRPKSRSVATEWVL